jgi:hypothetical protein
MSDKIFNLSLEDICTENIYCADNECKYAHPKWIKFYCIKFMKGQDHEDCGYKKDFHKTWE